MCAVRSRDDTFTRKGEANRLCLGVSKRTVGWSRWIVVIERCFRSRSQRIDESGERR